MRTPRLRRQTRARTAIGLVGAGAIAAAACNEHFITGPRDTATLQLRNWSDTLVVGEQRASHVLVLDADGREIVGARVTWQTATPAVLGTRLNGQTAPAGTTSFDALASRDSLALTGARAGTSDVLVALADSRFAPTQLARRATVVVAGVGVTSAHDTTVTSLGDTARVTGTAFMRSGAGLSATLTPLASQGLTWTRQGPGAVTLVGTGDSVRAVATAPGTDTLIATHAYCLRGARCADTTIFHVTPTLQPLGLGATAYRAWAFGDSVIPQVVVQDTRGRAVPGVQLALVPLTAADSAIVGVNTTAGVPATSRGTTSGTGPLFTRSASATATPARTSSSAPPTPPLLLLVVGRNTAAPEPARSLRSVRPIAASIAPAQTTPLTPPPLVAQANGTAHVAVQARLADGTVLGADTVTVIVRQVANLVHVTPAYSDLTPGDSIPVHIEAHDARGHLIQDATFQPAMAGATYRDGRIVVAPNATAGTGVLEALVTGVASSANNPGAPIPVPPPDTARIVVRVPPAMVAGDTTSTAANTLSFTVRDRDGVPLRNSWVRFRIPAGTLQGPDSVQSDANGSVQLRWTLPTQPGSYTATAVLLGQPTPADTAGLIVLRRTAIVTAGAPAALAITAQPPTVSGMSIALTPAPAVQLVDRYGNAVPQAGVAITASLPTTAGSGFTWGGTLAATTGADGQAHFTALTGSGAPGSYPLQFDATANGAALTPVVSSTVRFTVGAVQSGHSTVTISAPSIASGATATVTVTPKDALGNVLGAGQSVTITVPSTPAVGQATATVSSVTDRGDGTYTATLTGVRAGTALTIGATVGGVALVGPTLAVTAGAVTTLHVTPPTSTLSAFGPGAPYTATAADAAGNAVSTAGVTWTSSTTGVATIVAATGTPTAVGNGTTTITATLGGASATATLNVQQVAATLTKQAGDGQTATISTGVATAPVVVARDANGNPVVGAPVQFTIALGGGTVAGGASQTVTTVTGGLATAGAWVLGGTVGPNSLTATLTGVAPVTFTATAGAALAISNVAVEKLPHGTQQFSVVAGPAGPYTWSAGGVDGGNATYGTVNATGLYIAPASVPSPNVVQLCVRVGSAPTQRSCSAVTVNANPSPGADIVVMNDAAPLDDGSSGGGLDGTHAANEQFLRNLVGFTGSGPRATQTHVLVYQGHNALNLQYGFDDVRTPGSGIDSLRTHLTQQGFTMDTSTNAVLTIPANVKVLLLYMPTVTFSRTEVNAMKQFAAEGGRLVFVGNQTAFYASGVATENGLMTQLGSALVNTNAVLLNGAYSTTVGTHQLTSGVSGVWFNGCSYMTLGPNDFALMTDGAAGHVVMAVTKIDTTPIP